MTSNPISLLLSILLGLAAPAGAAAREVPTPGDAGELSDAFVAVTERLAQERRSLGRRYFELARLDEAAFVAAWDEPWEDQRRRLEAVIAEHEPPPPVARDERARITYGWALGRLEYEEVHRQVELDPSFEVGADYDAYLDGIEIVAPELASVEAYRAFLEAYQRHRARERRQRDPALRRGDNQLLRARLAVAGEIEHPELRCHLRHAALDSHLEIHGSESVGESVAAFVDDCPGDRADALRDKYDRDRERWQGHEVEVYKRVDGVELEAHVYPAAEAAPEERRPAVIWFHGGGWNEGAWYWCPVCPVFADRGMVRVLIEYRLLSRHGTTPESAVADAADALRWVRANADRHGVDAGRIVAAGFSSGGHLAQALATLPDVEVAPPQAVVSLAMGPDQREDPLMRMHVSEETLWALSPAAHLRRGLPPILFGFGAEDVWGAKAAPYAERSRTLDNEVEVHAYEGLGHMFVFQSDAARADLAERMDAFLARHGL